MAGFGTSMKVALLIAALIWVAGASTAAAQSPGKWWRAETPRVVVYTEESEAVAREYARNLEILDSVMLSTTAGRVENVGPTAKLVVYIVSDGQLGAVWPSVPDDVGGFYINSPDQTFVVAARLREAGQLVVYHEYAHFFMFRNFPGVYPGWVIEGFAEYYGATRISGDQADVGGAHALRAWAVGRMHANTLRRLLADQRDEQFYPHAWFLVHYLVSDAERSKAFSLYLADLVAGADRIEAFERRIGSVESVAAALNDHFNQPLRLTRMRIDPSRLPEITVTRLPAAADGLVLLNARVLRATVRSGADKRSALAAVRSAVRRHGDDPYAALVLARAEVFLGDTASGEAILQTLLDRDPNDAEALRLAAAARLRAGDALEDPQARRAAYAEARAFATRAFRIDPDDHRTLWLFHRSRSLEPDFPNDNDVEALLAALEAAPEVNTLRLEAVDLMRRRGDFDYALHLLEPFRGLSHGGGGDFYERRRARIEAEREAARTGAPPPPAPDAPDDEGE